MGLFKNIKMRGYTMELLKKILAVLLVTAAMNNNVGAVIDYTLYKINDDGNVVLKSDGASVSDEIANEFKHYLEELDESVTLGDHIIGAAGVVSAGLAVPFLNRATGLCLGVYSVYCPSFLSSQWFINLGLFAPTAMIAYYGMPVAKKVVAKYIKKGIDKTKECWNKKIL